MKKYRKIIYLKKQIKNDKLQSFYFGEFVFFYLFI